MYSGLSMQVVALKQFLAPPGFQSFPLLSMRCGFQDSSCRMVRELTLAIMHFALVLSTEWKWINSTQKQNVQDKFCAVVK